MEDRYEADSSVQASWNLQSKEEKMKRYYLSVDWGDKMHAVWVSDKAGKKVAEVEL